MPGAVFAGVQISPGSASQLKLVEAWDGRQLIQCNTCNWLLPPEDTFSQEIWRSHKGTRRHLRNLRRRGRAGVLHVPVLPIKRET